MTVTVSAQQNVALPAKGLRDDLAASVWPGVRDADDYVVGPRGAGANLSVDVNGGLAVVDGDSRGFYRVTSSGTVNVTLDPVPGSGESRIDLIVVRVHDTAFGDGDDTAAVVKVTGTADPDPDQPATPIGCLLLATIAVSDDTTAVGSGDITDQRGPSMQASVWPSLPATGSDGQIITLASGELYKRIDGDWVRHLARSDFRTVSATTAVQMLPVTLGAVYGSAITVPGGTPAGAVVVDMSFWYPIGDEAVADTAFEVSGDGGSTWLRGPFMPAGSFRKWSHVIAAPTGDIKARIVWADDMAGAPPDHAADAGGTFTCSIMPVA